MNEKKKVSLKKCVLERGLEKTLLEGDLIINMGLVIFQIRGGWQERGEEEIEGGGGGCDPQRNYVTCFLHLVEDSLSFV